MTLIPCKIEDIPAKTLHRASTEKASLISFLAMEIPAVKVEGVSGNTARAKRNSFTQLIKKENLPIRALTRKGVLYLVNTAKAAEFAI